MIEDDEGYREGPDADHSCFDHRQRLPEEGDPNSFHEWCTWCGRVRFESNGIRMMYWWSDTSYPDGMRYAWEHTNPTEADKPAVWRHTEMNIADAPPTFCV